MQAPLEFGVIHFDAEAIMAKGTAGLVSMNISTHQRLQKGINNVRNMGNSAEDFNRISFPVFWNTPS
jgi:hypothetical protein